MKPPIFNAYDALAAYNKRGVDIANTNSFRLGGAHGVNPINPARLPSNAEKAADNLVQLPALMDNQVRGGYNAAANATGIPAISYVPDAVGLIGEGAALSGANKVREAIKAVPSFLDRVTQGYNQFRSQ